MLVGSGGNNTVFPYLSASSQALRTLSNAPAVATDPSNVPYQHKPLQADCFCLSLVQDSDHLSDYQIQVRQYLEVFAAKQTNVECNIQGRKKHVVLGQVGIRCRRCAHKPLRQRGRGAVYYPTKLSGAYQAAQNMASSHLYESCLCMPDDDKQRLRKLRDQRTSARGGKQYWADGVSALGVVEAADGLRFLSSRSSHTISSSGAAQGSANR